MTIKELKEKLSELDEGREIFSVYLMDGLVFTIVDIELCNEANCFDLGDIGSYYMYTTVDVDSRE